MLPHRATLRGQVSTDKVDRRDGCATRQRRCSFGLSYAKLPELHFHVIGPGARTMTW